MIILDTNVVSALMRPDQNARVVAWLDHQRASTIWITAVTFLEGRFGLLLMPAGRRRDALTAQFERLIFKEFAGRIAPFDRVAAEQAAAVSMLRRSSDRRAAYHDIQIAGIALARGAKLATRNIADFEGLGLSLVNPWEADLLG